MNDCIMVGIALLILIVVALLIGGWLVVCMIIQAKTQSLALSLVVYIAPFIIIGAAFAIIGLLQPIKETENVPNKPDAHQCSCEKCDCRCND